MHLTEHLTHLRLRARALPVALRCLRHAPEGMAEAQERADDLLAELDLLLTAAVRQPQRGLKWLDTAEEAILLKQQVYGLLHPFLERQGMGSATLAGFETAARRDLASSARRLARARTRGAWPTERPVWGWA